MSPERPVSRPGALVRAGFADHTRAAGMLDELGSTDQAGLVTALGRTADPDGALLGLLRVREALADGQRADLDALLSSADQPRHRLLAVLGASSALTDHLVRHPEQWRDVIDAERRDAVQLARLLCGEVTDRGELTAYDALRIAYRRQLLQIAAIDLTSDPYDEMPATGEALADLAGAALEAALLIAREEHDAPQRCRLSVIGMGKTGGLELNYLSDVDVVFVAEPADGVEEDEAIAVATALATSAMRACSASTGEGNLWQVDANLRPEGKNGPLVRTVESHRAYYERWAKTWEFQALLKARPIAGDAEVGAAYLEAMTPMVWQASTRENFVEDVQAMRRRVEDNVPPAEAARQLKLGPGGLRDIEFSVQLLQLVHGRADDRIRQRSTLAALDALSRRGYVGRSDAHELDVAYRFLRVLEHRIQLSRMRRTHLMPTSEADLRRLGRSVGEFSDPGETITKMWRGKAREVRRLHERLFYRPLLSAVARLSDDDATLSPADARERLAALGFRDPAGAIRHIEALSSGVSRRAVMQRTLLPVMLQWFANEADPDAGLLAFRRISDELGTSPWYLKQLREGSSAQQLAKILASSRYAAAMLERSPSAVAMLDDPDAMTPRTLDALTRTMGAAARRHRDADQAALAARAVRRTELLRISIADLLGLLDLDQVEVALTDVMAATVQAVLDVAVRRVEAEHGELVTSLAVIGMGRFGGREMGYSSDADVMFVHRPHEGADDQRAQEQALAVVTELRRLVQLSGPDPALTVDADLRPEGKAGPLVRSLDSYRAYYDRWSEGWEAQALLRATPVAGDRELGRAFAELIDPLRWPADGLSVRAVRQIRTLKARMEAERIPRGGDRKTHFKLGHGGLADVEWTVQLLQLEHAGQVPGLRHPGTMTPLQRAADAGLLGHEQAEALREAWTLATRLRNASVLWRGRPVDALPSDLRDGDGIGRILGMPTGSGPALHDDYRRCARRARAVVDECFYGTPPSENGARPGR
ncbi:bifunctional [glutamine synthetase] adenylyltransferase/[glutamine synthetase]-adenylyl-L-tyrosine phosphorylase [Luteipulveratus sp. YIM 133132]|uniref:bifunctional [glutamine synthetase] adenylyltransferase/[glutamine synthetase]-adenylyl-L-tyrosine phosphorylase n=1 Tax=Luteipulveratus flavus TaxID=3031728 RepID=UPI0023B0D2DC|nr:bifunctional [glutamine synthetase] adenylyltransferase/[glutamine synthetase]-adenylyl-L-tyrosine phosphorylase [Luteipulveratus sp. YIM 133132]MDE9367486.1 bifunctional [glutamine synthetase] adenylyltransferase/[glutamine synthetase]-adenylyl-L-tyrosine phosphorylase [Luteipulveratus sp. YIM 133132]